MPVPMLQALDAVADAVQAAIDDASIDISSLRIVKTLRPLKALENIEPGWSLLVYVASTDSNFTSAQWDEYMITVAWELATECTSLPGDEHTQERIVCEKLQTITDEIRKRIRAPTMAMARPVAGMLDDGTREELNIISAAMACQYRVMHDVS